MTSPNLSFESLGLDDYERAKKVLNKAKHPGFVGRELFHRCASRGQVCIAVLDGQDVAVALIASNKLQALSVVAAAQGGGVGAALVDRLKPAWVSAIGDRVGWFEKRGYVPEGAARVGASGKMSVQLMRRAGDPTPSETKRPPPAKPGAIVGRCRVCIHPDRLAIESEILGGSSLRAIATSRDMSKDMISRHKAHISPVRAANAAATVTRRIETGARSKDVLFAELHRDALDVFYLGKEDKNLEIMIKAIRERRELVALEFGTKETSVTVVPLRDELLALPPAERRERLGEMKHRLLELEAETAGGEH